MIRIHDLAKEYKDRKRGRIEAVKGVSFNCLGGEVFGLLGPNGAGKTTTLRMLSTAIKPTRGTAEIMGRDVVRQASLVRREIGFYSDNTGLYGRLSGREILTYFGRLYGMDRSDLARRIDLLAELFDMVDFLDRRCELLSTGMQQKINIARTVIHSPPVMIFDEPTTGLDVLTKRTIVDFIHQCKKEGKTVLLSTHNMPEAEKLCDEIGILHEGLLYAAGPIEEIHARYGGDLEEAFVRIIEGAS